MSGDMDVPPLYLDEHYVTQVADDMRLTGVTYQSEKLPNGKIAIRAANRSGQAKIKLLYGGNVSAED